MTKTIMIVGAGGGLAQAVARRFGGEGWRVLLMARDDARLARQIRELDDIGAEAVPLVCDVTDLQMVDALVRAQSEMWGGIDILNYNAATIRKATVIEQPLDEIASDLLTNVGGAFAAVRAALPSMPAGSMILLSGGQLSITPWHDYLSLGLGKAALRNFAEGVSKDPAWQAIRIASVTIDAHITPAVGLRIADLFHQLQSVSKDRWNWDVAFSA